MGAKEPYQSEPAQPMQTDQLFPSLAHGMEIHRSLWDRDCLFADWDIEYVNLDQPGEGFETVAEAFAQQRPIVQEVAPLLVCYNLAAQHIMSGRGHHSVWRIPHESEAYLQLTQLDRVSPSLQGKYDQPLLPHEADGSGEFLPFLRARFPSPAAFGDTALPPRTQFMPASLLPSHADHGELRGQCSASCRIEQRRSKHAPRHIPTGSEDHEHRRRQFRGCATDSISPLSGGVRASVIDAIMILNTETVGMGRARKRRDSH